MEINENLAKLFENYHNQRSYKKEKIDVNGDGKINSKDKTALTKEAKELLKSDNLFDFNNDGKVDYLDLTTVGDGFDFDGDGKISSEEKAFLKKYKSKMKKEIQKSLKKSGELNVDDLVSFKKGVDQMDKADQKFWKNEIKSLENKLTKEALKSDKTLNKKSLAVLVEEKMKEKPVETNPINIVDPVIAPAQVAESVVPDKFMLEDMAKLINLHPKNGEVYVDSLDMQNAQMGVKWFGNDNLKEGQNGISYGVNYVTHFEQHFAYTSDYVPGRTRVVGYSYDIQLNDDKTYSVIRTEILKADDGTPNRNPDVVKMDFAADGSPLLENKSLEETSIVTNPGQEQEKPINNDGQIKIDPIETPQGHVAYLLNSLNNPDVHIDINDMQNVEIGVLNTDETGGQLVGVTHFEQHFAYTSDYVPGRTRVVGYTYDITVDKDGNTHITRTEILKADDGKPNKNPESITFDFDVAGVPMMHIC